MNDSDTESILEKDTPENNQQQKHVLVPDANVHVVGEEKTESDEDQDESHNEKENGKGIPRKKIQKENKRQKRIDR